MYRVTFANKAETNIKVEVEFSLIDANMPVNLSYPTGGLVDYLKPGQTGTLMTLAKTNPLGEPTNMDNLRIEVKTSTHADHDFNMNGYSSQTDVPGAKEPKGKTGTSGGGATSSIKDQRRNAVLLDTKPCQKTGDVGVGDDRPMDYSNDLACLQNEAKAVGPDAPADVFDGQKACGTCTFLNASSNAFCEMC